MLAWLINLSEDLRIDREIRDAPANLEGIGRMVVLLREMRMSSEPDAVDQVA